MTEKEFRQKVRKAYPHVRISVKTVSFSDLARDSRKCLTVKGDRTIEELRQINAWAEEAEIVKDGDIRSYSKIK